MRLCVIEDYLISTSIQLPASKSISNRALILHALSQSPFPIENLSGSDDTQVMLKAFESDEKPSHVENESKTA